MSSPRKSENQRNQSGGPHKPVPVTDLRRWRLICSEGRQLWKYYSEDEEDLRPQTILEKHALGLDTNGVLASFPRARTAQEGAHSGMLFYSKLQTEDGHWERSFGGLLIIMPSLLIVCYITQTKFSEAQRLEMVRYLRYIQCPEGGWGLHSESSPTVLGSALNYCAMRLLGVDKSDPDLVKARKMLHKLGGPQGVPAWGKFWLAVLNVYSWEGLHKLCPEIWLLPSWLPFHPSKFYAPVRQACLAMGYCYGSRPTAPEDELICELRKELYTEPYELIDWKAQRDNVSKTDIYKRHSYVLDIAYYFLDLYDDYHVSSRRQRALDVIYEHVCAEDEFTNCVSLTALSKVGQMLVRWHRDGPTHPAFLQHQERIQDYLWLGPDGMDMKITNGSQLWDTAFALQAFLECQAEQVKQFEKTLKRGHSWLKRTQMKDSQPNYKKYHKIDNKGGFPFSTRDYGWVVIDCTAEAVMAVMLLQDRCDFLEEDVCEERLQQAVDLLLSLRNTDGGFSSYETKRGGLLVEMLNPTDEFGDIMVDYSCVECTSSVMQALNCFQDKYPGYRTAEIANTLEKGLAYIVHNQREDGSWYGSWGVCFIYAAFFGLEAFACVGCNFEDNNVPVSMLRACKWLEEQRLPDGGWGEKFESCEQKKYIPSEKSQIVQTAWALLGLMSVRYTKLEVLEPAVSLLLQSQLPNGDWPQESFTGIFFGSGYLLYDNYRNIFPMWALGRFSKLYPHSKLAKA